MSWLLKAPERRPAHWKEWRSYVWSMRREERVLLSKIIWQEAKRNADILKATKTFNNYWRQVNTAEIQGYVNWRDNALLLRRDNTFGPISSSTAALETNWWLNPHQRILRIDLSNYGQPILHYSKNFFKSYQTGSKQTQTSLPRRRKETGRSAPILWYLPARLCGLEILFLKWVSNLTSEK